MAAIWFSSLPRGRASEIIAVGGGGEKHRGIFAPGGGALGNFLSGYVPPPGSPNWHPVSEKISPKIGNPFYK